MARFKDFYNESIVTGLIKTAAGKTVAKGLVNAAIRRLGMSPKSLNIASGGKYFDWSPDNREKFNRQYEMLKKQAGFEKKSDAEKTFLAAKYMQKSGIVKDNPYVDMKTTMSDFAKKFGRNVGRVASQAWDSVKNFVDTHGDTAFTILRALK